MSKRAIEALMEFKEVNLFLRGLVPMVGFKSDIVTYVRNERQAGESKYPLKKMLGFAIEGITSPDGRVLGKMGHSERWNSGVGLNVPGEKLMPIFESGALYYK
jgi:phosphoribosylformylglycinamidine (FGAM) synthase-like amidotransferase family enzyme